MKKILLTTIAAAALSALAFAPAAVARPATSAMSGTVSGSWVGRVAGTDAYIALIAGKTGRVVAYLCDGRPSRPAKTYAWFKGRGNRNRISLRSKGIRLQADLTRGWAKGTVTLANGRTHRFGARPARGTAGLYRARKGIPGKRGFVEAAWIVLADGSQRGATSFIDQEGNFAVEPAPRVDPSVETVDLGRFGTASVEFIDQEGDF